MCKKIFFAALFFCMLCFAACKNKVANTAAKGKDITAFFPLQAYFIQQVKSVSNTDAMYKLVVLNGKKDSALITKAVFDSLALQFTAALPAQFNNMDYKENVFHDESTNSNTISYSALDKMQLVQSINILLDPVNQQVKRVFFTKYFPANSVSVIQNFGWKNDERFYINTTVTIKDTIKKEEQLIVAWKKKG